MPKILTIDDKQDNLVTLSAVLRSIIPDCTIITALSGVEGIEKARSESPDTILLDIKMPGMDGYEVCNRLKADEQTKHIPVIMISAIRTESQDLVKGLNSGADAYLAKPIDEYVLIAQVNTALRTKKAEDQLRNQKELMEAMVRDRTAELVRTNQQLKNEIEERKQAEKLLKESESKLVQAQYISGMGDFTWDIVTGEVTCSKGMYRVLKYDETEEVNFPRINTSIHHSDDIERVTQWIMQSISSGEKKLPPNEYRINCKDGSVIHVHTEGRIEYKDGTAVKLFGTCQDITEQKKIEKELQKMQKLKSIGTLAGGIAHDFNNILMGLFGNISIAKDTLSKDHPGFKFLEETEKSMGRATRLTKQLLTFAKGGAPVREDVSIDRLAKEIVRFDLSGSNVMPVFEPEADLWMAQADKGQIQQVFSNLTINADQAMPDGGHLYIKLANAAVSENLVPNLSPGKYIKVTMDDEGTGIDHKYLDRIFDPYFSTKQAGCGLGLATVLSIINKHNGHISVDSQLGKGTRFTFYLPASESQERPETKQPVAVKASSTEHIARVLVMDDEKVILNVTKRMLERIGYKVDTALDGGEAIEICRQAMDAGKPFDYVIMDLTIPGGIGGKEAIKEILEIDPDARAIVSSGYADDPVMANYAEYGFKGMAAKPYTLNELREVMGQVLEK
ncbi:MAG: response regulator [Desulfobacteraceae bacterium]|nr:response regulator [Desulfobacteraceae bacterium]